MLLCLLRCEDTQCHYPLTQGLSDRLARMVGVEHGILTIRQTQRRANVCDWSAQRQPKIIPSERVLCSRFNP